MFIKQTNSEEWKKNLIYRPPCLLQYYFDPTSGRRFRSKIEVLYFLETGTLRKRKKDAMVSRKLTFSLWLSMGSPYLLHSISSFLIVTLQSGDGSEEPKAKKSSGSAKSAALNFDFCNVPEKVEWVLTDPSKEVWTPYIDNEKVPESTKREWVGAFQLLGRSKVWSLKATSTLLDIFWDTQPSRQEPPSLSLMASHLQFFWCVCFLEGAGEVEGSVCGKTKIWLQKGLLLKHDSI